MIKINKIILTFLAAALCVGLCACASNPGRITSKAQADKLYQEGRLSRNDYLKWVALYGEAKPEGSEDVSGAPADEKYRRFTPPPKEPNAPIMPENMKETPFTPGNI